MKLGTEDLLALQKIVAHDDLEVSFENSDILWMVFQAVHQARWQQRESGGRSAGRTPEPILRSLLTYCYALGVLGSEEVESSAMHDRIACYLCANHFPHWETIREFRRKNGPGLKQALSILFKEAIRKGIGQSISKAACDLHAEERLARAVKADSMALDD